MQEIHPVAYESRKLNDTEKRYSAHEKELLAVVHCLRLWRHYLLGSRFLVKMDNTAFSHFLSQPKLSFKQARWKELLAEFNFWLEYKAGSTNKVADALSRRVEFNQQVNAFLNAILRIDSQVSTEIRRKIKDALPHDSVSAQLLKMIEKGKTRQFWLDDGFIMTKENRVFVSRVVELRRTLIRECHDTLWAEHPGQERTLALLKQGYYWP